MNDNLFLKLYLWLRCQLKKAVFIFFAAFLSCVSSYAGDFTMDLGTNPDWPAGGEGPVTFTLADEYGFEIDFVANVTRIGGVAVGGFPTNEVGFFGSATSLGTIWDPSNGNSSIGESTNTATLSVFSGGVPFPVDGLFFVISDIDSVDNDDADDRCDFVTATGDNGDPTLTLVNPASTATSVQIGPGSGSGATGPLAANQAQCIYNIGPTVSPNSTGDDNGSIIATWPAGTSSVTVAFDESIENVYGVNNRDAAARGVGIWASSIITVNQTVGLVKEADISSFVGAGETINYTYTVTNNGPLPINTGQNIQINDDKIGIINCPNITTDIAVGGTLVCNASYVTTATDASANSVVNIAIAGIGTGTQSFATRLQSSPDSETVIREIPAISLTKTASSPTVAAGAINTLTDAGDTIAYSYTVNNTGNVPIENVIVSDAGPTFNGNANTGTLSVISPSSATIPVSGSQLFTATYTISQQDVDNSAGLLNAVQNTASATGASTGGVIAISNESSAESTIAGGAEMEVIKIASSNINVPVGTIITYSYRVTNTGNQTISNITLNDVHNGSGTTPIPGGEALTNDVGQLNDSNDTISGTNGSWDSLAPGDEITFTATYEVTQQDIDTLQ